MQALCADLVDEDVNERLALAGRLLIQLEEAPVIALDQGISSLQCMGNWLCELLLACQRLEHPQSLRLQLTKNVVQELVT